MKPDRVVLGSDDPAAIEQLKELYEPFVRTGNPILVMDARSAEMSKYAANAMLATKISFINSLQFPTSLIAVWPRFNCRYSFRPFLIML
jgi:UDPglucose 6-dehydrogenase